MVRLKTFCFLLPCKNQNLSRGADLLDPVSCVFSLSRKNCRVLHLVMLCSVDCFGGLEVSGEGFVRVSISCVGWFYL